MIEIPTSVQEALKQFHNDLTGVEEAIDAQLAGSTSDNPDMSPLDKAKLDLTVAFSVNSLLWMYLSTRGEVPKETAISSELERIKDYMDRLKHLEDKALAPRLNKSAARNFVRNATFDSGSERSTAVSSGSGSDQMAYTATGSNLMDIPEYKMKLFGQHKRFVEESADGGQEADPGSTGFANPVGADVRPKEVEKKSKKHKNNSKAKCIPNASGSTGAKSELTSPKDGGVKKKKKHKKKNRSTE